MEDMLNLEEMIQLANGATNWRTDFTPGIRGDIKRNELYVELDYSENAKRHISYNIQVCKWVRGYLCPRSVVVGYAEHRGNSVEGRRLGKLYRQAFKNMDQERQRFKEEELSTAISAARSAL